MSNSDLPSDFDRDQPIQYRKGAYDPRYRPPTYLWKIALVACAAGAAWFVGTHL